MIHLLTKDVIYGISCTVFTSIYKDEIRDIIGESRESELGTEKMTILMNEAYTVAMAAAECCYNSMMKELAEYHENKRKELLEEMDEQKKSSN